MNSKITYLFIAGIIFTGFCVVINLLAGTANITLQDILNTIIGNNSYNSNTILIFEIRIPKTLTALIAGWLLAQCGLLMQTYFQNPLAGPYVLGISSGASLGVALFMMSGLSASITYLQHLGAIGSAFAGAVIVTLLILIVSLKNTNVTITLIIGLLLNYFISSLQSMIEYYASANSLKNFNTWLFGNLNSVGREQLQLLVPISIVLSICLLLLSKHLNLFAAGKTNAIAMGLNYKRFSIIVITLSAFITAIVTSYCGPISFIGMIVPFSIRWYTKSNNHFLLLLCSGLYGASLLLLCDFLGYHIISEQYIPVNIILGMFGIPLIVLYLIRNKFISQ